MFDHELFLILVNAVQINLFFGELCSVLVSALQGVVGKNSERLIWSWTISALVTDNQEHDFFSEVKRSLADD